MAVNLSIEVTGDEKTRDDEENINAYETATELIWPDMEDQNRQNRERTKRLNIGSNAVGLGVFAHRPSLIGDCYEQSEAC